MGTEKKPPTWGLVVGILGICFGALGLMGGGYELMMPMMMSMQKKMMGSIKNSLKEQAAAAASGEKRATSPKSATSSKSKDTKPAAPKADPDAAFKVMEEFMFAPPWYERFGYVNGSLQLILSALYVLASVFLLLAKRRAATFFLSVAGVSAVRNLVAIGVGLWAGTFFAFWSVFSGFAGFLMDLVLIIIVLASDRSAYRAEQAGVPAE